MPNLQKQECHGTRNWRGFPFFSFKHWCEKKTEKKKDKIKYNHHYPTRSLSMPWYFLSEQSAEPWRTGSTVPELKYCPNPGGPRCPICVPTLLPVSGSLRGTGGNGDRVSGPSCRLCWQASDEQPLALAVSPDANTAHIFSQWHFPLDIATARSAPRSFIFRFFKVTLSLKRKVLIFIQRKKKRAFQPLLWVHSPKLAPWHFFKLHVHCS